MLKNLAGIKIFMIRTLILLHVLSSYIQVFIVSYLIKYYDISDDVSNHSCVNYRVCCETVHYLVHTAISYL